ncbi:MAG: DUF6148 family protein [Alphaproteobacteria bacterium]|nr:DUF6148 family protein [Alphaproteobacteria bacterium]
MSGLTLEQAQAQLLGWLNADTQLQSAQSVRYNERLLTRADAVEVRNNIDYWQKKCQELSAAESGRGRSRTVSPRW